MNNLQTSPGSGAGVIAIGAMIAAVAAIAMSRKTAGATPPPLINMTPGFDYPWVDIVGGIQPAPHIHEVLVWGDGSISDSSRQGNMAEDDNWDRQYRGYLEPGEEAVITVPLLGIEQSSNPGGCGLVAWFASDSANVHGLMQSPYDNFPFHIRPVEARGAGEYQDYQEWKGVGGFAYRDSTTRMFNGPISVPGTKFPNLIYGGIYTIRIKNYGATRARVVIRAYAGMSTWLKYVWFMPPEDWDIDIQPIGWACLIDGRLDWLDYYTGHPTGPIIVPPEQPSLTVSASDNALSVQSGNNLIRKTISNY